MKYVCNHERTLEALRTWSGPSKLIHASYFFWNAGEVLQKSQEGLLKSLLYQILRQCPTMISSVCSQRQVAEPWTRSELFDAVHRLAVQDKWQARFCFFVDSLDEYDGDHLELIDLLRKLAASPYVKLCVSSRPWNAFIDAFDKSKWRLTLQDLTWEDMTAYVADELAGSDMFRRICAEDPRANSLVTQISEKAQGVWLWVYLVVRSLLRGLRGLDDFPLLQKRLDEFPADLMDFFRHMFRRIETVYRKPTARLLQLMVVAKEPLPVAALAFLERESDDPDYALIDTIPPVDASSDGEKWQKRLNQRCTDLVEIDTDTYGFDTLTRPVNFLHRTVKDFLADKDMQEELRSWSGSAFDEWTSLCRLCVAIARSRFDRGDLFSSVKVLVSWLACYARQVENYYNRSEAALLDKYLDGLAQVNRRDLRDNRDALFENAPLRSPSRRQDEFLCFAIKQNMYHYVVHRLKIQPIHPQEERSQEMLLNAIAAFRGCINPLESMNHLKILSLLFPPQLNPNQPLNPFSTRSHQTTAWEYFLAVCNAEADGRPGTFRNVDWYYQAAELFIRRGAAATVKKRGMERFARHLDKSCFLDIPVETYLEESFSHQQVGQLLELLAEQQLAKQQHKDQQLRSRLFSPWSWFRGG